MKDSHESISEKGPVLGDVTVSNLYQLPVAIKNFEYVDITLYIYIKHLT